MTWYRTGTVSVTNGNTTITGAGTQFVANVSIGEGIILPDGRIYEIADVPSNTSLIIGTPYLGSTSSGQSYAIAPLRGRIATLLAETSSLIASFADVRDGPGAGIFPNGTAASPSVRFQGSQSTGFFRPANNQIAAAINGNERWLMTNTSVQFDGSEIYRRANILGTVSQSSGNPTGAIIQRGSNANGEFIRYADGTQICWKDNVSCVFTATASLVYDSSYPAAFIATPALNVTLISPYSYNGTQYTAPQVGDGATRPLVRDFGNPATRVVFNINRPSSSQSWASGDDLKASFIAIGRWF